MRVSILDKIAAQPIFGYQVRVAERFFLDCLFGNNPTYPLTKKEEERLISRDREVVLREFNLNFEKYCQRLYGPRRVRR